MRSWRAFVAGERGAVSFELILVFVPVFVMFLAVVQVALIGAARLLVENAASRAARSAAVVVDDSPSRYDGEPAGQIASQRRVGSSFFDWRPPSAGNVSGLFAGRKGRLDAIRFAASLPLAPLAPAFTDVLGWLGRPHSAVSTVAAALGSASMERAVFGVALYHDVVLAVTPALLPDDTVRVRVEYLFHCAVPIASRLLCSGLGSRSPTEVPSQGTQRLLAVTPERFFKLSAEGTWVRQRYHHGGGSG